MISFEEALQIILGTTRGFGTESIPLANSLGRVLEEDIVADRDMPPFNRVTMDGIAIELNAFKNTSEFYIEGMAPAGSPQQTLTDSNHCIEVMTGAMLPDGTDTVIRYEDIEIDKGYASIQLDELKWGQNVHKKGEDRLQGDIVVNKGASIGTPEIGVAASVGKHTLLVSRLPKIAIISTGDELVEIEDTPEPYQIRKSNVHKTLATLQAMNVNVELKHLKDDYDVIYSALKLYLNEYDVLLLSGGVSKGKFDYLPKVLDDLGVKKEFHRIQQRPGKPFWFGTYGTACTIFAFPGNPVSSFMCFNRYFLPWLYQSVGVKMPPYPTARLLSDVTFKPDLTYFLEVKIHTNDNAELLAEPIFGHGSGDFSNLVDADAFIQLPRGKDVYKKGEIYPVIFFRN